MAVILPFLLYCSILMLFILYGKFLYSRRHLYKCARTIQGLPGTLPIIGDALSFTGDIWEALEKVRSIECEDRILKIWGGFKFIVATSNPELMKLILNNHLEKDEDAYNTMESLVGNGLIRSTVPVWKQHRKIITPSLCQKNLDEFVETFAEQSEILVEKLANKIGTGEFDVSYYFFKSSMAIVCQTMMGTNIMSQDQNDTFYRTLAQMQDIAVKRTQNILLNPKFLFNLSKYSKIENDCSNYVTPFIHNIINTKISDFENRKERSEYEDHEKRKSLLDRLIESRNENKLTSQEMIDECKTMMIGGYETSGITEGFMVVILGYLNHIQDNVIEELNEIYGDSMRSVTVEDLPKMKYIERAILETLRLFPVGPIIARKIQEDVKFGKHTIPAGCTCGLDIYKMQRDEKYWGKNATDFDPDRFLPENLKNHHPDSFLAFSGGLRGCIGKRYAMMSIKVFVATFFRSYKVSSTMNYKNVDLFYNLFIKIRNGFMISIERRNKN